MNPSSDNLKSAPVTEHVSAGIGDVRLKRHYDMKSILAEYWNVDDEELDLFKDGNVPCIGFEFPGEEEESLASPNDMMEMIELAGHWAFADVQKRVIHVWNRFLKEEDLACVLAHEIGHCVGTPLEDTAAEEDRANSYGFATLTAIQWAREMAK